MPISNHGVKESLSNAVNILILFASLLEGKKGLRLQGDVRCHATIEKRMVEWNFDACCWFCIVG